MVNKQIHKSFIKYTKNDDYICYNTHKLENSVHLFTNGVKHNFNPSLKKYNETKDENFIPTQFTIELHNFKISNNKTFIEIIKTSINDLKNSGYIIMTMDILKNSNFLKNDTIKSKCEFEVIDSMYINLIFNIDDAFHVICSSIINNQDNKFNLMNII